MEMTLLGRIQTVSQAALNKGALSPLQTQLTNLPAITSQVNEDIVVSPPFQIRLLQKDKKPRAKGDFNAKAPPKNNPFLPYDPALYVQHLPPSHVLLLNKVNIKILSSLVNRCSFRQ